MMWAITPRGAGQTVGARPIEEGWDLAEGETFTVETFADGMVLAEDGQSLRPAAPGEIPAPPRLISLRDFMDRIPGSAAERLARQLAILASDDAQLRLGLLRASAAPFNIDSPETGLYIDRLVALGLLDAGDKAALLA